MIVVNGTKYRTLADKFYVNGARVYEAYANGVKVYPEDATVYYAVVEGTAAGSAKRTLSPDENYLSEYNVPITLSVPYTVDYSYAYMLPTTYDPELSKVELSGGLIYCDGELVKTSVYARARFGVGLVSPQEAFSILNQGGDQYTIVSRTWYHGLNVLSSVNGLTVEGQSGLAVHLDDAGVDSTFKGEMYPVEQEFDEISYKSNYLAELQRYVSSGDSITMYLQFYEVFETRTMEAFFGSVNIKHEIYFMNLYTGYMDPPGNETLRIIGDLDDV